MHQVMDVERMSTFFALLTVLANLLVLGAGALAVCALVSAKWRVRTRQVREWLAPSALGLAWVVALIATLGSLFYSQIAHYVPCELCWYQRIAMYPMALLLAIAALRRDSGVRRYLIPLAVSAPRSRSTTTSCSVSLRRGRFRAPKKPLAR